MDHTTLMAGFPNCLVGLDGVRRWRTTPLSSADANSQSFDGAAASRNPDTMLE